MTANNNIAGAAPTQLNWTGLNWSEHEAVVKKLQVRIAKAVKENRWGRVKALQRLLTTSFSAKVLAIRKVTQNKGRNTPGTDGITIQIPKEKAAAVSLLGRRGYQPKPLRRVYIKKKNGKLRPLSIPSVHDRCMQQLHYLALSPISEVSSDKNSYGFRPERGCADAIAQTFISLSHQSSAQWILEGDIRGCFDNISHDWMLNNICMDKVILSKWLKAGYIESKKLFPTHSGTPQGGIVSPCLSNFVLDGIEKLLDDNFGKLRLGINFVRYADDFIVTARTRECLEQKIKPLLTVFLKERGLELSADKTKITHISDGFDFLGQNVRKYPDGKRMKLLIKPSKENVKSFLKQIRKTIHDSRSTNQVDLIKILNPKIRGWANYHSSIVAKRTYNKVDHAIWRALWNWAKRKHQDKGTDWVLKKYFSPYGLRSYCFSGIEKPAAGKAIKRKLVIASDIPIVRHIKIRHDINIFDPQHEEYFEARTSVRLRASISGLIKGMTLLKRQGYLCVCCGKHLYSWNKWTIHLLTSRLKGGDYKNNNLCIVHDFCHRKGFQTGFVYKLPVISNRSG
jgi:RNA-directed DNA polymerase